MRRSGTALFWCSAAGLLLGKWGAIVPALDLLNLAYLPLVVAMLAGGLLGLSAPGGWLRRLPYGIGALIAIALLWPMRAVERACPPGAAQLKVAWINVENTTAPDRVMQWLRSEKPETVGLAELGKQADELRGQLTKAYPYWHSCLDNGRCSTVIFSRLPVVAARGLASGNPENRKTVSAVAVQQRTNNTGAPIVLIAAHLSRVVPLGRQARELQELEQRVRPSPDTVVVGDFNMSPRMALLQDFAARNGLTITTFAAPTWPSQWNGRVTPRLWQIDQVLPGRNWRVTATRLSPPVGSDHRGFVADLCRVN